LRPARLAVLPRPWSRAAFLPDGHTLLTRDFGAGQARLWDTADPRRPLPGMFIPTVGQPGSVAANSRRLLVIPGGDGSDLQVWNARDVRKPVLDTTIPAGRSLQSLWFLGDTLLGVVGQRDMQLWDLADPRHPAREGIVPDIALAIQTFMPSSRLLTGEDLDAPTPATDTAVWSLANPRKPVKVADIDADPQTISWVDAHTIAASTAGDNAIGLWRVRSPGGATQIAALPSGETISSPLIASDDGRYLALGILSHEPTEGIAVWQVSDDHERLSALAQLPGGSMGHAFSPDNSKLATSLDATDFSQLQAFLLQDTSPVLYPLDADIIYRHLCSAATSAPVNPSWRQYLPTTYYRPACSLASPTPRRRRRRKRPAASESRGSPTPDHAPAPQ
jgi:WD40 repeat protein